MNSETKSEVKHNTPAPWQASGVLRGGEPTIIIRDVFQVELARIYVGTDSMAEDEANARLIAAAPELLEALALLYEGADLAAHELLHALNDRGEAMPSSVFVALEKAKAAISKATGAEQ